MSRLPQGRKPITDEELAALTRRLVGTVVDYKELYEAAVRDAKEAEAYAAELEAENKRLNEQMDAIEEMGTESLNALPDCLMKLAPALVENDELKAKLAKAVATLEYYRDYDQQNGYRARTTLAELKGDEK